MAPSESTVEDAVKSVRTVQRIVWSVSLLTVALAASLEPPVMERKLRYIIQSWIEDDSSYNEYIADEVINMQGLNITNLISKDGLDNTFILEEIGRQLAEFAIYACPISIRIGDLTLGSSKQDKLEIDTLHIDELILEDDMVNRINNYREQSDYDIEMVILTTEAMECPSYPSTISNESKLEIELNEIELGLTIRDIYDDSPQFAIEYITLKNIGASIRRVVLEDRSFVHWVERRENESDVIIDNDLIHLRDHVIPQKYRDVTLNQLLAILRSTTASDTLGGSDISFLGISVPARIYVVAVPLVMIGLLFHFFGHIIHLHSVVGWSTDQLRYFAWIPLLSCSWNFFGNVRIKSKWIANTDSIFSLILCPSGSLIVLCVMMHRLFGYMVWIVVLLAVAVLPVLFLGIASTLGVTRVRSNVR